jgi:hypothetical protein
VPRRPGGGVSPRGSIEAGLRELVVGAGPDVHRLSRSETENLLAIMETAQTPIDWPPGAKAAAVMTVTNALVHQIKNPRWRAAALAAFRLPANQYVGEESDSLAARWRLLAQAENSGHQAVRSQAEAYREYWVRAASQLAARLEDKLQELNSSAGGWEPYRTGNPSAPPHSLPISFDRTDVLYQFRRYQGVQSISYRWLMAHAAVDHYEPVGWYYNEPDAPVEIIPLANCTLDGPLRDLPQGGRTGRLAFAHTLIKDERYFFAYLIRFNSNQPCRPTILYEVRGLEMRSLIVRAQFDPEAVPYRCWYFDVETQNEGWSVPSDGAPEMLPIASNGYVEHEFINCRRGRKFGLRWQWENADKAAAVRPKGR